MKGGSGSRHENASNSMKILMTSLSAVVAETSTFPLDLIKTRLQLCGQSLSSSHPTNAFRVAFSIVRQQGPLGLYKGLSPAIIRHMFYTPVRIVGYENLRSFVSADSGSLTLPTKAFVGGVSGVIAQVSAACLFRPL